MTTAIERVRFAITVFDEPSLLCRTLGALAAQGLGADQICLIAKAPTLAVADDAIGPSSSSRGGALLHLLCTRLRVIDFNTPFGGTQLAASEGAVLDLIFGEGAAIAYPRIGVFRGDDRHGLLDDYTHDDDILLVVLSVEPRQQLAAVRALLAGSARRVTTHEYASAASTLRDHG